MNRLFIQCAVGILVLLGAIFLFLWGNKPTPPDAPAADISGISSIPVLTPSELPIALSPYAPPVPADEEALHPSIKLFSAASLYGSSVPYDFSMQIPSAWNADPIKRIEAISMLDPSSTSTSAIDKSQVFIRYFKSNTFLTLSSVKILSRKELVVAGRPAVEYVIEKKQGYPNFPNQPAWRNARHTVVDIRAMDAPKSLFYVFAKHPDLSYEVFMAMLETIKIAPKNDF